MRSFAPWHRCLHAQRDPVLKQISRRTPTTTARCTSLRSPAAHPRAHGPRRDGAGLLDAGLALAAEARLRLKRCSSPTDPATTISRTGHPMGGRWCTPPIATTRWSSGCSISPTAPPGRSWPTARSISIPAGLPTAPRSRTSPRSTRAAGMFSLARLRLSAALRLCAPERSPPTLRQPSAPLLLQPLRSLSLPCLVSRRQRADRGLQPRSRLGLGDSLEMEARPGRLAGDPPGRDQLRRPGPIGPRWPREVVYSSYLGGQRNQLWLTPSDGGDPFQLSYCACDDTVPRWSPRWPPPRLREQQDGNTSLRVVTVPGGITRNDRPDARRYLHPSERFVLPRPTPVVRRFRCASRSPVPMAGLGAGYRVASCRRCLRSKRQELRDHLLPMRGAATLRLPAGTYTVEAFRGLEYASVTRTVTIRAGGSAASGPRSAAAGSAGPRLVERRPARAHELRRRVSRRSARLRVQAEARTSTWWRT